MDGKTHYGDKKPVEFKGPEKYNFNVLAYYGPLKTAADRAGMLRAKRGLLFAYDLTLRSQWPCLSPTRKLSAAAHSFVKPSALHCSEPTPLWTKNSPSGSYFLLISASRG
jgi:hypothetical protein